MKRVSKKALARLQSHDPTPQLDKLLKNEEETPIDVIQRRLRISGHDSKLLGDALEMVGKYRENGQLLRDAVLDRQTMELLYEAKSSEIVTKLFVVLDYALTAVADPQKLAQAKVQELVSLIGTTIDKIQLLSGKSTTMIGKTAEVLDRENPKEVYAMKSPEELEKAIEEKQTLLDGLKNGVEQIKRRRRAAGRKAEILDVEVVAE